MSINTSAKFGDDTVSRPGFGAMGMSAFYGKTDEKQNMATLAKAVEIGNTTWNTADMYGNGQNEILLGKFIAESGTRDKVFVITKFGNRWGEGIDGYKVDGSPEYARSAIDASIQRLGFTPDAWALHRVDKNTPIESTVAAMDEARTAGKTRYIGLSECSATTLRKAAKVAKIDFIEVEYSPWELVMEKNGVLATAKELGIAVLAYSPLGRGFLTGRFKSYEDFADTGDFRGHLPRMAKEVFAQNYKIVDALTAFAEKKGCKTGQLVLAWLMAQGDNIIPIPGTRNEKYLIENFESRNIRLSPGEIEEVRDIVAKHAPIGDRYMPTGMQVLDE